MVDYQRVHFVFSSLSPILSHLLISVVMRFSVLASNCPEYCALRAKSRVMARVWRLGHGILWVCLLSLPGAVAVWWVSRGDPGIHRSAAWSVVAPILLFAAIGLAIKRHAIKEGESTSAVSD